MKKFSIVASLLVAAAISSCGQKLSDAQQPPTSSVITEEDSPMDNTRNFPASEGWENPYPGLYLRTVKDSKGNIKNEQYVAQSKEAMEWYVAYTEKQAEALKKGITPLALDGDKALRLEQRLAALQAPRRMLESSKTYSSAMQPLAGSCTANGYAWPTSPTAGAKAKASAGGCTNTAWEIFAQATNQYGQSPIDSDNYGPTNITTVVTSRVAYVYGIRNCNSRYSAHSGNNYAGNSNWSCS